MKHRRFYEKIHILIQCVKAWILTFEDYRLIKGKLMKIWKSHYMFVFIKKQYPENFALLILRIFEFFAREVCKFLKKKANFYLILLFLNVCKPTFHISHMRISQNIKVVLMWNFWYIFMWRKSYWQIFEICIDVLLCKDYRLTR